MWRGLLVSCVGILSGVMHLINLTNPLNSNDLWRMDCRNVSFLFPEIHTSISHENLFSLMTIIALTHATSLCQDHSNPKNPGK